MSSQSSSSSNASDSPTMGRNDLGPPTPSTRKATQNQTRVKPPVPAPRTVMLSRSTAQSVVTTHTEFKHSGEASITASAAFRAVSEAASPSTGTRLTKIEHGKAHLHLTTPPKRSASSRDSEVIHNSSEIHANASRIYLPVMKVPTSPSQVNQGYSYRNSNVFRERLASPQGLYSLDPEREDNNHEQRSKNRRSKQAQKRTSTQTSSRSTDLDDLANGDDLLKKISSISSEEKQVNPEEFENNVRHANSAIQRAWDHMASSSYQQACHEFQEALTSIDRVIRVQIGTAKIPSNIKDRLLVQQNNLMYKRKEILEGFCDAQAACRGNPVSSSPTPGAPPSYDDVLKESQAEVNRFSHGHVASVAANRNSQIHTPQSPTQYNLPQNQTTFTAAKRLSQTRPSQIPPRSPSQFPEDNKHTLLANRNMQVLLIPTPSIPQDNPVSSAATADSVSPYRHIQSVTTKEQLVEVVNRKDQPTVTPRRRTRPLSTTHPQNSVSQPSSIAQNSSVINNHNNYHSSALRSLNFSSARNAVESNSENVEEVFPWQTEVVQSPAHSSLIYPNVQSMEAKNPCLDDFELDASEKIPNSREQESAILCSKVNSKKISDDSLGMDLLIPFVDDMDNSLNNEISNKDIRSIPDSGFKSDDNNKEKTLKEVIVDPFLSTDPFKNEIPKNSAEDIFKDISNKPDIIENDNVDEISSDISQENIDEEYSDIDPNEISNNFTDIGIKQTSTPARCTQTYNAVLSPENPEHKPNNSSTASAVGNIEEPNNTFSDLVMSRLRVSEKEDLISNKNERVPPKRSESVGNLLLSFNTPHAPVGARPSVLAMFDPLKTPKSLNKNKSTNKSLRHSMYCSTPLLDRHSMSMGSLPVISSDIGNTEEENESHLNNIGEEEDTYSSHSNSKEDIPEAYLNISDPPPYSVTPDDHYEDDRYGTPNKDILSVSYSDDIPKIHVGRSSFYPDLNVLNGCKLKCGECSKCQRPAATASSRGSKKEVKSGIEYLKIREGIKIFFIFENGKVTSPWQKPVLSISHENVHEGDGNGMMLRVGDRLWSCQLNKKVTIVLRAESKAYIFAAKQSSTIHHSVSRKQKCSAVAVTLPSNLRKNYEERLLYLLRNNCRIEEEDIKGISREVETVVSKGAASAAAKVNQIMPGSSQTNSFVRRNSVRALRKAGKVMTKKLNIIADKTSISEMELPEEYATLQEAAKHLQLCRSKKEVEYL